MIQRWRLLFDHDLSRFWLTHRAIFRQGKPSRDLQVSQKAGRRSCGGRGSSRSRSTHPALYQLFLLPPCLPFFRGSLYVCSDWKTSTLVLPVLEKRFLVQNRITWEREKGRGARRNWKNNIGHHEKLPFPRMGGPCQATRNPSTTDFLTVRRQPTGRPCSIFRGAPQRPHALIYNGYSL